MTDGTWRILLVEDDSEVSQILGRALLEKQCSVAWACSGMAALNMLERTDFDLLIIDVGLPDIDGFQVCRRLRQKTSYEDVPILFLTAYDTPEDEVRGFEVGGTDYVTKPFSLDALMARVGSHLDSAVRDRGRSPTNTVRTDVLQVGELVLDEAMRRLSYRGHEIALTRTEFLLLEFLMKHPNQTHATDRLLEAVWDCPADSADTSLVRRYVRRLREKIETNPGSPQVIHTVYGHGYALVTAQA